MKSTATNYVNELLQEEDSHIKKLNLIVAEAIKEEDLIIEKLSNPTEDFQ